MTPLSCCPYCQTSDRTNTEEKKSSIAEWGEVKHVVYRRYAVAACDMWFPTGKFKSRVHAFYTRYVGVQWYHTTEGDDQPPWPPWEDIVSTNHPDASRYPNCKPMKELLGQERPTIETVLERTDKMEKTLTERFSQMDELLTALTVVTSRLELIENYITSQSSIDEEL